MVDDDQLRAPLRRPAQPAEAVQRAAVEGHHQLGGRRELLRPRQELETREVPVVRRRPGRARGTRRCCASRGREHVVEREHRAQRVAVGRDVAGERDHLGAVDRLGRAGERFVHALEVLGHERPSSSGTTRAVVDRSDDLLDALALRDRRIFGESQLGHELQPHLLAEHRPQARTRRAQRVRALDPLLGRAEHRVVHVRVPDVRADLDAGQRHEAEPRVRHPLELVGQRLAHDLVHRAPRAGTGAAPGAGSWLEPGGLGVEQVEVGGRSHEALHGCHHLLEVGGAAVDQRDADRAPAATGPGSRPRRPTP